MKKIGIILALLIILYIPVYANIHRVPSTYISTIQGGIDLAIDGDTVLVQPGIYYENINFKGKNIIVASNYIFDEDTITIHNTVIDGKNRAAVVTFNSGEDSTATIKGFTIRNGSYFAGGGIYCMSSSPRIARNIIIENTAVGDNAGGMGGGIYCYDCSAIIEYNHIIKNRCLTGDWGSGDGGGIFILSKKPSVIRYNLITLNVAVMGENYPACGGGIFNGDSAVTLIHNNTIVKNIAELGGGIFSASYLPGTRIFNNIIVFNTEGIRTLYFPGNTVRPDLTYNDFWLNQPQNFYEFSGEVGDTTWGFNSKGTPCDSFYNVIRNPLFVDMKKFNFHLSAESPCIDSGDPFSPFDPDTTVADMGAFYYHQNKTYVKEEELSLPEKSKLLSNYPNPFNPATNIRYEIYDSEFGKPVRVTLKIYNLRGQLVKTLVEGEKLPGRYNIIWNGKTDLGRDAASGIYFYQLRFKDYSSTEKMILLR